MSVAAQQAYMTYKNAQVMTASPEKLVSLMYDALRTRVKHARLAMAADDHAKARLHIEKAQAIVAELMVSLDMSKGEIAQNLFSLYEFVNFRLISAITSGDHESLEVVSEVLATLGEAWAQTTSGRATTTGAAAESV